uniref:hypothetical protein n=1 Tax=Candidatus Albibeggiatoa sp. nov. BB20 TaxID=3162723 RepID=UPI003365980B
AINYLRKAKSIQNEEYIAKHLIIALWISGDKNAANAELEKAILDFPDLEKGLHQLMQELKDYAP